MQPKRRKKDRPRRSFFRPPPAAGAGAISRPRARERVSDGDNFAPRRERFFVSDWDSFAPRRKRFFCLRWPHFFQQRKKWGKERRQKLRFCTSSARYTALVCKAAPPRNRHFLTRCRSADCASTAFRCRCLLLRQKLFALPCRRLRNNYILCPTGTPTFAAARRQRRDLIIANPVEANTPTVAEASGRGSLRAGERRHSPFDRQ